jgi:hypothetical protein
VQNVELILAALAAGAGTGASDAAKAAVLDAYTGLRDTIRSRLAGRHAARQMLDAAELEPDSWPIELAAWLEDSGAASDEEIIAAARRLLTLADPDGVAAGKYHVDAGEARGVQVGDHNTQHNTFS